MDCLLAASDIAPAPGLKKELVCEEPALTSTLEAFRNLLAVPVGLSAKLLPPELGYLSSLWKARCECDVLAILSLTALL